MVSVISQEELDKILVKLEASPKVNKVIKWNLYTGMSETNRLLIESELQSYRTDNIYFLGDMFEKIELASFYEYKVKFKGIYKDKLYLMVTIEHNEKAGLWNYEIILFDSIETMNKTFWEYF